MEGVQRRTTGGALQKAKLLDDALNCSGLATESQRQTPHTGDRLSRERTTQTRKPYHQTDDFAIGDESLPATCLFRATSTGRARWACRGSIVRRTAANACKVHVERPRSREPLNCRNSGVRPVSTIPIESEGVTRLFDRRPVGRNDGG